MAVVAESWIVVANATRLSIFAQEGPGRLLRLVDEIDHPAGRSRFASANLDEKRDIMTRFGGAVGEHINVSFREGRFTWLFLVVEEDVLPIVRERLDGDVRARVRREEPADLAALPRAEVTKRLLEMLAA